MSRTSVLIVTGEYPPVPGGIGDYTANLRLALAALEIRTVVLSSPGAAGEGVRTVRRWGWTSIADVLRLARRERVDLVHIQYQAGAFGLHPAVNVLPSLTSPRLPVVTTFHDLRVPYLFPKAGRLRKAFIVRMARESDIVIVTNPADARALGNEGIAVSEVPIGPNLPPPGTVAAPDTDTIAFFGFPARSKGIADLIAALGQQPVSRPTLLLVGAQGEPATSNDIVSAAEIDNRARAAGVDILRTGFLPVREASVTLARAGAIVLPFQKGASLRSGSLLAALQSGRPVVTTAPQMATDLGDLSSLPQLVLTPAGDIQALGAAITDALAWSGPFAPLPSAFRWQSIAAEHAVLYRRIVAERLR